MQLLIGSLPKGASTLVLLRSAEPGVLMQAARLPAQGFILQTDLSEEELSHALSQMVAGRLPIPKEIAQALLARASDPTRTSITGILTARELEVLALLVKGLPNKQIAAQLGITEHGAKRHVANVLAKLNCPNRATAVARAIQESLVAT